MLLILMNHFLQMDMMQVACYPVRAINTLLCRLGGVGDDIFLESLHTTFALVNRMSNLL